VLVVWDREGVDLKSPCVIEASANIDRRGQTVNCCPPVPWKPQTPPFIASRREPKSTMVVVMWRGGEPEPLSSMASGMAPVLDVVFDQKVDLRFLY
jgi:hypothetical protein